MTDQELKVQTMVQEICAGRRCSCCPISGYCLPSERNHNPEAVDRIIQEYYAEFGQPNDTELFSAEDIMSVFE